ncbi:MAG: hypothetical protein LJE64_12990 [Desulfofustis sp.]|jgi:hypothetical protein|nr:hypothetical protein [Desulfofustis sp.]
MAQEYLPDYIVSFMNPDSYDHPVTDVQLIQTHISYVLITDRFVYKFKKPVDFGFLDFSTLEKRAFFCEQEVTLNRRLCPDIYLGRVGVHQRGDGYLLGGDKGAIEYGVKMARMDESAMMSRVMAAGALSTKHLDRIVETLVPFYASAEATAEIKRFGLPERVAVNVIENFDQTESFVGGTALGKPHYDCIKAYATGLLKQTARFERRIADGRIRDCHGDLYSANICLADPVHIFDCIEFNDRLRYSDVAGDIGFLAMDLDYHGLHELADYFVDQYAEKAHDRAIFDLIAFYKCYRAYVRGKISLFTAADPGVDAQTAASCTEQARRYFTLAARYAEEDS